MIQSFEEKKLAKPAPGFDEVIGAMYACLKDRSDIAECVAIDKQFTDRIDRAMTDLSPAAQGKFDILTILPLQAAFFVYNYVEILPEIHKRGVICE